jgi:dynein regulatory complex protein 1
VDREREPAKAAAAVLWQLGVRSVDDMYSVAEVLAGPEGTATAMAGIDGADDGAAGGSVVSVGGGGMGGDGGESAVAAAAAATSRLEGLQVGSADVVPLLRVWAEDKAKSGTVGLDEPGVATGFMEEEEGGSVVSLTGASHTAASPAGGSAVAGGDGGRGDSSGKASLTGAEVAYWRAVADAVPDGTVRVWTALEKSLQKHLAALRARAGLLDDVDELRAQNEQLRGVLAQYLRADVNKELAFPPAATARLAGGV